MQRALHRLSSETFDLLIIGGGATGCFTARDAALRGLTVALVEARDFAGATSAHNSKLAHGGLRYLRNFEFALVRESLRERRNLMRMAPHLVRPLPFVLPLYRAGLGERAKLAAGLTLYDLLSYDRNRLEDPSQRLPGHRWLNAKSARTREPVLAGDGFEGAFMYHDAQMYMPERIALENLLEADAHGAVIANYVAAETLLRRGGKVEGCAVTDKMSGARFDIRARTVLVAAGPWADLFLEQATGETAAHKLIRSKGIHLLVPQISHAALALEAGNGHLFALPWRGHTLLATTDTPFRGDPDTVAVRESDIEGFLATFRKYLPAADLARGKVAFFYAGLRPLVRDGRPKEAGRIATMSAAAPSWWIMARKASWTGCSRRWAENGPPRARWRKKSSTRWPRGWKKRPPPAPPPPRPCRADVSAASRRWWRAMKRPGPAFPACATWRICWVRACRRPSKARALPTWRRWVQGATPRRRLIWPCAKRWP